MKKEREGRISEKITSFVVIVGLQVRVASVFRKKSDAVCGFLAYFCVVLRFLDPPYAPLLGWGNLEQDEQIKNNQIEVHQRN